METSLALYFKTVMYKCALCINKEIFETTFYSDKANVFGLHYEGEIENAIIGHFEFVFEDSGGEFTCSDYLYLIVTSKLRFQNPFRPASVFKVLGFE